MDQYFITPACVSVRNLEVFYNKECVLFGLNFSLREGEFVAVLGRSGCGKTTFLHALAGFLPFRGEIITPPSVGVVFQQYAVFPWLTVGENITFGLGALSLEERERVLLNHLRNAHLEKKRHVYPDRLSGGETQRVALARSFAPNPQLLLMDEPFAALDAHTRDMCGEWLLDLWSQSNSSVILVTHNIEEAIFLADRVLVLQDGVFTYEFCVPFSRLRAHSLKFEPAFVSLRQEIFNVLGVNP